MCYTSFFFILIILTNSFDKFTNKTHTENSFNKKNNKKLTFFSTFWLILMAKISKFQAMIILACT